MQYIGPRVPNFHPFLALRSAVFKEDMAHFKIFPLSRTLNFKVPHNCYFLVNRQNIYTFIFPYDYLIYNKFGSDWMKILGRVAF